VLPPTAEKNDSATVIPQELLRRRKSRSDLDNVKVERYGGGCGLRGKSKTIDVGNLRDELDFADWYREFEDELEDANSNEYRYGASIGYRNALTGVE